MDDLRLYSFVAGLYLSPLQCGLQTAHIVSELYATRQAGPARQKYADWAEKNKTIIILNALNSGGVISLHERLVPFAVLFGLPLSIFYEDEVSLGGAATAVGVVVPKQYFDVEYDRTPGYGGVGGGADRESYTHYQKDSLGEVVGAIRYDADSPEFNFINIIKGYRLV
jgi:hypothetical protein